jgi:hypothetical protein
MLASFQNAESVARTSGSESMPLRILVSVMRRNLFQLVALALSVRFFMERSILKVLPVGAALVRLRAPGRDDAPFVIRFVDIDHRNFQAVYNADGINARLAVVEPVIHFFEGWTVEDADGVSKGYAVHCDVAPVLIFIPTISHGVYLHNVNIRP